MSAVLAPQVRRDVIIVTGADLAEQAVELLAGFDLVYAGKTPDEDQLVALCTEHQPVAIIVRYGRITARVIDASPRLRVISKHGSGTDNIDKTAAAARGIAVKAAVGANAPAVAEHAWALILACAKNVSALDQRMHDGHWDKATHKSLELRGRTLGLVGLGAIGARVAAVGRAMEMTVIAHDPFAKAAPEGVALLPLADVIAQADVLSLHCPLTQDNANMLNAATLATMRPGAIVVNTARGGLIDEAALADALKSGALRAAGLDSFQVEPFAAGHPFTAIPNAILSPHIGGVTGDAYVGMGTAAARNVLTVLEQPA
ncbi:hydroxyacid dehydrogenase [Telluria mixta]|uniref:Hydroxyacid dehydrogenase n=1 Tax=Telluria mixta TaxID=34071 RepID=A0ABT2C1Y3_9BURK|nr:hydroxyacid dehydrogenase [Telluria mixta]MCS0631405.1 hydroxyacid dehydrogenase [Telluria mixta]WEM98165.1 hydroxyacid dehydrogenase [Telluria mixta]